VNTSDRHPGEARSRAAVAVPASDPTSPQRRAESSLLQNAPAMAGSALNEAKGHWAYRQCAPDGMQVPALKECPGGSITELLATVTWERPSRWVMSDCIDFKESTIPMATRWSRRGDGPEEPSAALEPMSDRATELARTLRIAWLQKHLDAYLPLLRDLAPEFGYSSRALARALRITPRHLQRMFAATLGQTPQSWLNGQRLLAARQMLQTACTVKEVAYSLGFHSASQLSRDFKSHFGVAPSTFLASQYARSCPNAVQDGRPAPSLTTLPQRGRGDSD